MHDSLRGFTLLELLLVVGILAILGSVGVVYYRSAVKDVEIVSASRQLISDARRARSNALAGQQGRAWGIHFINSSTSSYYQMYSTPTNFADASTSIEETTYLNNGITFTDPSTLATKDVLFSRVTGTTASSSVTLSSQQESILITITSLGVVY